MVNIYRLSNGIQVALEALPYYRSASLGVWVKAGSVNENKSNNGMAHVIEHMLFKGTGRRSARELADAMTEIGGNVDAYTTKEYTCYYAKTLREHLYRAIDLLSDMLTNSVIDEQDLKKELGVITDEIDMYDDSPEDIVHERLQEAVWKDHPLGFLISGEKSVVQAFKREDVLDFMARYYTAERTYIAVSGCFDEKETLIVLEKAFGGLRTGKAADAALLANTENICIDKDLNSRTVDNDIFSIKKAAYYPSFVMKPKDIEQVHLTLAFDSIDYYDSERYVCSVANNLLGGNVNSRLFQTIREEMGLAYAIYSYGSAYEQGGLFHIYAAVQPEQVKLVVLRILSIIDELKAHTVSERELHIVKEQLKTELMISDESTYSRMSNYGKYLVHQERIESMEEVAAVIERVTVEDVQRFMQRHFDISGFSLSLAGGVDEQSREALMEFWQACRTGKR